MSDVEHRIGMILHRALPVGHFDTGPDCESLASAMLSIDTELAQDIKDGQALRLLLEALPSREQNVRILVIRGDGQDVFMAELYGETIKDDMFGTGETLATAASHAALAVHARYDIIEKGGIKVEMGPSVTTYSDGTTEVES